MNDVTLTTGLRKLYKITDCTNSSTGGLMHFMLTKTKKILLA